MLMMRWLVGILCLHAASGFVGPSRLGDQLNPTLHRTRWDPVREIGSIRRTTPEEGPPRRFSRNAGVALSGQDVIEAGVSFDTFAPQFLWLLIIAKPESSLTKRVMGSIVPILGLASVHILIVLLAAVQEGALSQVLIFQEVFDPSMSQLKGMQKLFEYPNFVAEEWPHVLIWDLFVGRAIWLDGLKRGIDTRFALAFCNFIGPPGLLIHAFNCIRTGKGLPDMGSLKDDESFR